MPEIEVIKNQIRIMKPVIAAFMDALVGALGEGADAVLLLRALAEEGHGALLAEVAKKNEIGYYAGEVLHTLPGDITYDDSIGWYPDPALPNWEGRIANVIQEFLERLGIPADVYIGNADLPSPREGRIGVAVFIDDETLLPTSLWIYEIDGREPHEIEELNELLEGTDYWIKIWEAE